MIQPIIFRDDSLARGIETAGSALGTALMHNAKERRKQEQFAATNEAIGNAAMELPENPTATDLAKLISKASRGKNVNPEYFNQTLKPLMSLYSDRIKAGETSRFFKEMFPDSPISGGNNIKNQQIDPVHMQQNLQNQMIQRGISPYMAQNYQPQTPQEQQIIQQQQMQQPFSLQGIPGQSNFQQMQQPVQSPQQQLMQIRQQQQQQLQQGQPLTRQQQQQQQQQLQQQQLQQPPEELPPSERHTIDYPGVGNVSRGKINLMLMHPNQGIKNLAQSLDQRWNDQYKQGSKEQAEIRKEYRHDIVKYSEPYQDINKIETGVNKLKEAQKLIQSGRVSLDDNWVRNVVSGFLEGHESPLAEVAKTPEQQKLWYLLKDSLKSKEVGGSNPSTKEVLLAKTALPGDMKSQDANEYIIGNMLQNQENELFKAKTIREERGKAGTPSFIKFQTNVDDKVNRYSQQRQQEYDKSFADRAAKKELIAHASNYVSKFTPKSGNVWMMTPNGKTVQVPEKDIKKYESEDAVWLNKPEEPGKEKWRYSNQPTRNIKDVFSNPFGR